MRYIVLNEDKKVTNVRNGDRKVNGEIESEKGELGQLMQGDGTFITPDAVFAEEETISEKIERLERTVQNDNLTQLEVLATIYEEILMKG